MSKTTALLGSVCVIALVAGGGYAYLNLNKTVTTGTNNTEISVPEKITSVAYWNGTDDINQVDASGKLPLIEAVLANDAKAVKFLLENGASVDMADGKGRKAVETAFEQGYADVLEVLSEKENLDFSDAKKYLTKAIDKNNPALVKTVLNHGGKVNDALFIKGRYRPDEILDYKDIRYISPLKKAVEEDKPEVADVLLANGAEGAVYFLTKSLTQVSPEMIKVLAKYSGNLRTINVRGTDLLSASVSRGRPELIAFLMENNVGDLNEALQRLLTRRENDADYSVIAEKLIEAGATPKAEALEMALKQKNMPLFTTLSSCMVDLNVRLGEEGNSLLRYMVDHKYPKGVEYLLERGADMWHDEPDGITAIHKAVERADDNSKVYLAMKAKLKEINDTGYDGETLLMLLAQAGQYKEFMNVVNAGGDIWAKDYNNRSVLMYAAESGDEQIINYLISKGDNVDATDDKGKTPLMYAAEKGNLHSVLVLIGKRASMNLKDKEGKSAIIYAAESGSVEVIARLLDAGEKADDADKKGKSVLMYAAEKGNVDAVDFLLDKGADVLRQDKNGTTVLSYAVQGGDIKIVKTLLENKVSPIMADRNGYQPFTWALKKGYEKIADLVMPRDGIILQTTDNGRTLLMYALEGNNGHLIQDMMNKYYLFYDTQDHNGENFSMWLARYHRPDLLKEILVRFSSNIKDKNGKNALMYAAESQSGVNLIYMMSQSSASYLNIRDNLGRTALMYAVGGKYNLAIKAQRLLTHGADVNAKDKNGKTVLMYALGNLDAKVDYQSIRELLDYHADIKPVDKDGKSALMYAAGNPNVGSNIVEMLLNSGADAKVQDKQGKTILMYAAESMDITKMKMLLENGATVGNTDKEKQAILDIAGQKSKCFGDAVKRLLDK